MRSSFPVLMLAVSIVSTDTILIEGQIWICKIRIFESKNAINLVKIR